MTKNRTPTPVYLDPGMHPGLEVKGLNDILHITAINCGDPPILSNTQRVMVNGTVYSSIVQYTCTDPYDVFSGIITEIQIDCTDQGNWGLIAYPLGCHGKLLNRSHCTMESQSIPTRMSR